MWGDNGEVFNGDDINVNLAVHHFLEMFSPAVQLVPVALQDSAILGNQVGRGRLEELLP